MMDNAIAFGFFLSLLIYTVTVTVSIVVIILSCMWLSGGLMVSVTVSAVAVGSILSLGGDSFASHLNYYYYLQLH